MREALLLAFRRSNERLAALFERSLEAIRIGRELRAESVRLKVLGRALKRGPRVPVKKD